jgi:hypothetical protein
MPQPFIETLPLQIKPAVAISKAIKFTQIA